MNNWHNGIDKLYQPCYVIHSWDNQHHHNYNLHSMTTLEAAAEFGYFTTPQLIAFLKEHGLSLAEAEADLGDSAYDAVTLCRWIGY